MLSKIDLVLDRKDINIQMGSLFHGFLMELIDSDYAGTLHQHNLNPFSQYIFFDKEENSYVWRINGLTEEVYEKMIKKLAKDDLDKVYLQHKDMNIKVIDKKIGKPMQIDDFALDIYKQDPEKRANIRFLTPTSFKSNGYYINMPKLNLIYRSSAMKLNQYSKTIKTLDESIFEYLEQKCYISKYNLRSSLYHLEQVKIRSFVGEMTINNTGNDELKRLGYFLLKLGEYTGVGIKTAIGMGGVLVE